MRYEIEDLFLARIPHLSWAARNPARLHKPFSVEATTALAARADASLVRLLATWLTWADFTTAE